MGNKGLSTLLVGLALVVVGGLFLAVNLTSFEIDWVISLKLVLPALFILVGGLKLFRHYTWSDEELLARPGKAGLLGGLFWLGIGTLLLLDVLGKLSTIRVFGLYWPVLIIAFGVGKIVDYYRLEGKLQFRVGEVFGVVFIVVFGFACNQLVDAHFGILEDLGWGSSWPRVELGEETFSYELEETVELDGIKSVEIRNVYGDVIVEAGTGALQAELTKVIAAENEEESVRFSKDVEIVFQKEADALVLQTNRESLGGRGKKLTTHLRLRFPPEIPVIIRNGFGEVEVKNREAGCQIENSYGEVRLEKIVGTVSVANEYAPVDAREIEGGLSVRNRRAPISARGVSGDVEVVTDHSEVTIRDVGGETKVENEYGDVMVSGSAGAVRVRAPGSSVAVSKSKGPVTVQASHKDVRITEIQDRLELETSYSDVRLSQISGPVQLTAVQSEVRGEKLDQGALIQGRGSEISLSETRGKVHVETSLRRVSVLEFRGPLEVQNEFAEIDLRPGSPLSDPILAVNKNGDITLAVAEDAGFNLSAQAVGGDITSEFGPRPAEAKGDIGFLEVKIGAGGPLVELQTTDSRIRIRKRG